MTWQDFYLVCFVVGFALAVLAFLSGAFHWPLGHGAWLGHLFGHGSSGACGATGASPLNAGSLMAFLAWFGGVGYLLARGGTWPHLAVLFAAAAAGITGAFLVFVFVAKVLLARERPLDAADFHMEGVLGRVTVAIRPGGTGEVLYSQGGTRRSAGARSESGEAIPRGAEVVVTRYDKGIAYVRLWEELAGDFSGFSPERVVRRNEVMREDAIMKRILWFLAAVGLALLAVSALRADDKAANEKAADAAARKWLALVDGGNYAESWKQAASAFRKAVTAEQWTAALNGSRGAYGSLVSRTLESAEYRTTVPGAPDGEYVVLQYESSFEHKKTAVETVTPMKDGDGAWRVSGYYIK